MKGLIIKEAIKHAPKLKKAAKLTSFQKIIRGVKSSSKVIQQKLKTKQNLASIGEKIGDIRNSAIRNKAVLSLRMGNQKLSKYTVGQSHDILKNRTTYLRNKSLNKMLNNYMIGNVTGKGSSIGPKTMIRNLVKAKGLIGKIGPLARFAGPAFEIHSAYETGKKIINPKDNIIHSIRNLATSIKHVGDKKTYRRTRLAGEGQLAQLHNKRVDSIAKWDNLNKEKSDGN